MSRSSNPILETYLGFPIRRYNRISMRLDPRAYRILIDEAIRNKLSIRQVICLSSVPCNKCSPIAVRAYNKEGEIVSVRRGILGSNIPSIVIPANDHR